MNVETGAGWQEGGATNAYYEKEPNGYPGLSGTVYTQKPDCVGAEGSEIARPSASTVAGEPGKDMEGKFSKIQFEIKNEPVELTTFETYGTEAQHEDITHDWSVERGGLQDKVAQGIYRLWETGPIVGLPSNIVPRVGFNLLAGDRDYATVSTRGHKFTIVGVGHDMNYYQHAQSEDNLQHPKPGYRYALFIEGGGEERIEKNGVPTINELWDTGEYEGLYSTDSDSTDGVISNIIDVQSDSGGMSGLTVTLCPGDEGYIQANKGQPASKGEGPGGAGIYPYIQITELGEDCT